MEKDTTISICIDLGSDALKIVCADRNKSGRERVSKVVDKEYAYSDVAIPAIAYYDKNDSQWRYGYSIGRKNEKSYSTVVKIKDLLSILRFDSVSGEVSRDEEPEVKKKNKDAYENGHIFPLFEFPITMDRPSNYSKFCESDKYINLRFESENSTPKEVCENFFGYVSEILVAFLKKQFGLRKEDLLNHKRVKYTLICPPKSNKDFVCGYENAFRVGFGLNKNKEVSVLSSAKVLGAMALTDSRTKNDKNALLFDIGEEQISVVKFRAGQDDRSSTVSLDGMIGEEQIRSLTVSLDGMSGHNFPQKLGGNDIDKAIVEKIEGRILSRNSIGSGHKNSGDGITDYGLKYNDYLFMRSVKAAKALLGEREDEVPVNILRDVEIITNLSREEFKDAIGIKNNGVQKNSVAGKILDYIRTELTEHKGVNRDADTIYLSGGAVGTYGLIDAIRDEVKKIDGTKTVKTFRTSFSSDSIEGFEIAGDEVYSYAPAISGALSTLRGVTYKMVLTRSYGMRLYYKETNYAPDEETNYTPFFSIIANKGTELCFSQLKAEREKKRKGGKKKKYGNEESSLRGGEKEISLKSGNVEEYLCSIDGEDYIEIRDTSCGQISAKSDAMPIYSTLITDVDIQKNGELYDGLQLGEIRYEKNNSNLWMLVTPTDETGFIQGTVLKKLSEKFDFVVVSGARGVMACYYQNMPVSSLTLLTLEDSRKSKIQLRIYFRINEEGIVDIGVLNDIDLSYGSCEIWYDAEQNKTVSTKDIEVRFENVEKIDAGASTN